MEQMPLKVIAGSLDDPLIIGDIKIPCFVLEGETRVLSQGGVLRAIGRHRVPRGRIDRGVDKLDVISPENDDIRTEQGVDKLPVFLRAQNLQPFITDDLIKFAEDLIFEISPGSPLTYGYDANVLPEICDMYLAARRAGAPRANQMHIAEQAEILLSAFGKVAITALVDEATGYQDLRSDRALAIIAEQFIAKSLRAWTKTFPPEYVSQIYRLKGWDWDENRWKNPPQIVGKYTNDIVYSRLAPGVLGELRSKNPVLPQGYRRYRFHQWLTSDYGHPRLREHIAGVIALMRASKDWDQFMRLIQKAYPKFDENFLLEIDED